MQADFWHERWKNNQIGFHRQNVNAHLQQFWKELGLELSDEASIFVPLCGKSHDLNWLARQGHNVLGIELSALAVEAFFQEQALTPQISQNGALQSWSHNNITLFCGDFFALESTQLSTISWRL